MHRQGINPENATPGDFLCDFCGQCWADDRPMVEGHRGSLICAKCLTLAFDELWNRLAGEPIPEGSTCVLCLERRDDPAWASPMNASLVCKRCAKQSVVMLERDPDSNWKRPNPHA